MPLPSFEQMVPYVSHIKSEQINALFTEVEKVASAALLADYCNVETISADKTLTNADSPIQRLTPSGANRDVSLPTAATTNHLFFIANPTGTSYSLVVKSGATTLATLSAGEAVLLASDSALWRAIGSNTLFSDVEKIASAALLADYSNVETLSVNKTLTDADFPIQRLTPSGANRDVSLPAAATTNHLFFITNPTGTSYSLAVKSGATTLATISAGEAVLLVSDGALWRAVGSRVVLSAVRVYTSSNPWYKPADLHHVIVEVVGGGASGAGAPTTGAGQHSCGTGGAGGGYSKKYILAAALAATETVTVGAGGAAAAGAAGNPGGTSSFGSHLSATGGGVGVSSLAGNTTAMLIGSTPGTGSGGTINVSGQPGKFAARLIGITSVGGEGGCTVLGTGGAGVYVVTGGSGYNGNAGNNYGGGGGGGVNAESQATARSGGAGAPGLVIVYEYTEV